MTATITENPDGTTPTGEVTFTVTGKELALLRKALMLPFARYGGLAVVRFRVANGALTAELEDIEGCVYCRLTDVAEVAGLTVAFKPVDVKDALGGIKLRDPVTLVLSDAAVIIRTPSGSRTLRSIAEDGNRPHFDLPEVTREPGKYATIRVDAKVLAGAYKSALLSAGRDITLPVLTGILLEVQDSRVTLASTDRFRLGVHLLAGASTGSAGFTALLPQWPGRILPALDGEMTLEVGDGDGLTFWRSETVTLVSRQLGGDFPKYRRLFPDPDALTSAGTFDNLKALTDLLMAAKRVSDGRAVEITVDRGAAEFIVRQPGEEVSVAFRSVFPVRDADGAAGTLAFDPGYLRDAFLTMGKGPATFKANTSGGPALVVPENGAPLLTDCVLVMPIKLNR